jgi:hypothetical protein
MNDIPVTAYLHSAHDRMPLPSGAIVHRCKDYRGCTREIPYRLRRLHLRTTAPEPERTLDAMILQRPLMAPANIVKAV